MRNLKLISIGVLSLLALVIILQNTDEVRTRMLFMTITMPLAFLLFLTALLGFLIGILVSLRTMRKRAQPSDATVKSDPSERETE